MPCAIVHCTKPDVCFLAEIEILAMLEPSYFNLPDELEITDRYYDAALGFSIVAWPALSPSVATLAAYAVVPYHGY